MVIYEDYFKLGGKLGSLRIFKKAHSFVVDHSYGSYTFATTHTSEDAALDECRKFMKHLLSCV